MNPADDLADPRTREEAQMDRLRECLAWPSWGESSAIMIFAGFLPNKYSATGWETLPGQPDRRGMNEYELAEYKDDMLTYVSQFIGGEPRPPIDWLRMARKNGFSPNWLSIALGDENCRRFLPPEFVDIAERSNDRMKRAQIRKGLRRSENDPIWKVIEEHGHVLFATWWREAPHARRTKEDLAETIRTAVIANGDLPTIHRDTEQVSAAAIKNHIRTWIIDKAGLDLFRAWQTEEVRCPQPELVEAIRQEISKHVRHGREVPSAKSIVRRIEQWQAKSPQKAL